MPLREAPSARVISEIGPAAWAGGGSDFSPLPAKQDSSSGPCERQACFPTQHALHLSSLNHSCWAVTIFWWLFTQLWSYVSSEEGTTPLLDYSKCWFSPSSSSFFHHIQECGTQIFPNLPGLTQEARLASVCPGSPEIVIVLFCLFSIELIN